MSAFRATRGLFHATVSAVRRRVRISRRCIAAGVLLSYLAGMIGLPMPLAAARGIVLARTGHNCCCPSASVLAGTCCCRQGGLTRSCCAGKASEAPVAVVVRDTPKTDPVRSCCQSKKPAKPRSEREQPRNNELQFSVCPCGSAGPDASLICADPRLPMTSNWLPAESGPAGRVHIESASAPSGTLEPQTPPPRA
ncbi:MAG: hypothetical protein U0992_22355 [Planctomycetaceae bacterium]